MQVTIERAPLLRALRLARAAVARHAADAPPVLGTVRLDADPVSGTLRLDATDGALALTRSLPATVSRGWRRAVAAHPLAALVADLPDGSLTLAATDDTGGATLAIAAGGFRAVLPTLDLDALPASPEAGPRCTPPLDAREVAAALAFVAPAAARDEEAHPAFAAVCCAIEFDSITLTAVDGYRLARARLPFPTGERVALTRALLLPARAVALYRRLLSGASVAWVGLARAAWSAGETFHLVADAGRVIGRPVRADVPRYAAAIPADRAVRVTVDRARLLRAARLACRIGGDDPSLLLLPSPAGLRVVARDPDSDAAVVATLPTEGEAPDDNLPPLALAARGLLDPLRLSPGRAVTLAWRESDEAVTIGGGIGTASDQDRLWVVMPQHNPRALERELCRRTAA